jgi:hypothetical protein
MKIKSTADVFELLGAYVPSATLGLALELGLFWKLAERARTADEVAKDLNIPINRCRYWLDIMVNLDLLDTNGDIYLPSELASTAILSTLSQDAWRNIANESRDSYPCLNNLPEYIHEPGSNTYTNPDLLWQPKGLSKKIIFSDSKKTLKGPSGLRVC